MIYNRMMHENCSIVLTLFPFHYHLFPFFVSLAFTIGFVKDAYCVNESAGVVPIEVALHAGELRGNQYIIVKLILADGSSSSKGKKVLIVILYN